METSVATRRKTSPIWDYFTIAVDDKFAKCAACELQLGTAEEVRSSLQDKVAELKSSETEQPHSESEVSLEEREEPASKCQKTALLRCFSEILQEAGASVDDSGNEVDI